MQQMWSHSLCKAGGLCSFWLFYRYTCRTVDPDLHWFALNFPPGSWSAFGTWFYRFGSRRKKLKKTCMDTVTLIMIVIIWKLKYWQKPNFWSWRRVNTTAQRMFYKVQNHAASDPQKMNADPQPWIYVINLQYCIILFRFLSWPRSSSCSPILLFSS